MRSNPSKWSQRIYLSCVSGIAAIIAIYMGLFQWGLINYVWDPFFKGQTELVLTSNVSHIMYRWCRVPDAILGAISYLGDIIFAFAGSNKRWHDRPWVVMLFGIYVIPPAMVSIILVLIQAFVLGKWCFLCLVTAVLSVGLIGLALNEVIFSLRYLRNVWHRSKSKQIVWNTLWGRPSEVAYDVAISMEKTYVGTHS